MQDFFSNHEGVHLFSWSPMLHGYGVVDRYLECFFRCSHLAAALSHSQVLLFNPQQHAMFFNYEQKVELLMRDTKGPQEYLPCTYRVQVRRLCLPFPRLCSPQKPR